MLLRPCTAETLPIDRLAPPAPPPGAFVTVRGATLVADKQPIRLWGAMIDAWPDRPPLPEPDALEPPNFETLLATARTLELELLRVTPPPSVPEDTLHALLPQANIESIRLWTPAAWFPLGVAQPEDAAILDDPASNEAWRQAIAASARNGGLALDGLLARIWDPRLELLTVRRLRDGMRRFNPTTGLRWSDDPAVAVWELAGVARWQQRMHAGEWRQLPGFFRMLLHHQWNAWLHRRYDSDDMLQAAWGFLLPGESLQAGTVMLLPDASHGMSVPVPSHDADAAGAWIEARRADLDLFYTQIGNAHRQRVETQARLWGDSVRRGPLVWGVEDGMPACVMPSDQARAFRLTVDELIRSGGERPEDAQAADDMPRGPRFLLVAKAPGASQHRIDAPWRVVTRHMPWSIVCWDDALALPESGATPFDASLAAAGMVFRHGITLPPPEPTPLRGDLTLDTPFLAAFCRDGTVLESPLPAFLDGALRFTAHPMPQTPDPADDETAVPDPFSLHEISLSGALLAADQTPMAQATDLTLFFGASWTAPSHRTEAPRVILEVQAETLTGRAFQVTDRSGQVLRQGHVTDLPFRLDTSTGAFRVRFRRETQEP